jgi:gliding motility-associated-like protein
MKKSCYGKFHRLIIITALSLSVTTVAGQGFFDTANWRYSNPKRFGFTVFDLDFFDNNKGIAAGANGGIAFTNNGGANWAFGSFTFMSPAGIRTASVFNDVHFITSGVAYAVGSNGGMVKTIDGGITWNFVTTPLFANSRNINALWFVDANKGYIGGQWNTADSIPKLYITLNGGATWDSINAPPGGKTRVGYINNPNLPSQIWDVTAKGKEIHRIEFTSPDNGYIIGSGQTHFPPIPAANATTCLPTGGTTTTSANNAALVWKFSNGVLTDFSLSKERLGYSGINTNTITCTSQFNAAQITPVVQTYKAMSIINDTLLVIMSLNNNTVLRIHTGSNDNTVNLATGLSERGRYQIMSFTNPPTQGPQAGPPIPNPNNYTFSQPNHIRKAANGKLFAPVGSSLFAPENRMWTSVDTGRSWQLERNLPTGRLYSNYTNIALDILPSGRFVAAGNNGVVSDSLPGGAWNSSYVSYALSVTGLDMTFADCNNGIVAGGSSVMLTNNGGNSWTDRSRADFASLNISINGISFPALNKAYFATSVGNLYRSTDGGVTMDPIYANGLVQLNDVATAGNDTIWATAYSAFSVPAANRTTTIIRSINNGVSFQATGGFPVGTTSPNLGRISFVNNLVGYIAGTRNGVYKTTDGGSTWTNISPFPSLNNGPAGFPNSFVTYQEIQALDANTVFVIGNMFTNVGVKRVYKTTDGGANWTDITGSIPSLLPVGNLIGLIVHDANNLYVSAGNGLFKTNNGGTNWTMDVAPAQSLFETMAFAPAAVPTGISMANRKLFLSGLSAPTASGNILEYGNPAAVNVNASETVVNANCTNLTAGSITVNASGGIGPYTYSINGGAFQASSVFSGLTQGPKTITIKDAYCGTLTKTVTVGFTDNLVLTTNNDTIVCASAPVQMLATTNGTGAAYSWSPGSGLSAANISNPIATVNANSAFTVTATLNGCVRNKTVNVGIKPNPVISAGTDKLIVEGDQVQLQGSANNAVSVAWTPVNTLSFANTLFPVAKPQSTTVYTLTVRNSDNCTATDNVTVTVIPYCVKVMEAFTPNGDGTNDRWLVTNGSACTNQIRVAVYNRYGQEVYKNENYQNNWDGTYGGKPVPDGTYYYAITYSLIGRRTVTVKGDVTILR